MQKGGNKILCELHPYEKALVDYIRTLKHGSIGFIAVKDGIPMTIKTHEKVEIRTLVAKSI